MMRRTVLRAGLLWLMSFTLAWSAQDRIPVRVGVFENPPIISALPGTPPEGIAIDVIRGVAEQEGWQITYVPDSFDNLVVRLGKGEIDLLTGIAIKRDP